MKPIEQENQIKANNENLPKRQCTRVTRSTASLTNNPAPKLQAKSISFVKFNGLIKYYTLAIDISTAAHELVEWVNKKADDMVPIAFDMEWPFSFQTGSGKAALLQVCLDVKECYLFQLSLLKKIPTDLLNLLSHPKVRLHGVNVKNDIRKLKRDFPEVDVDKMIDNCIDLGCWCNEICGTGGRWSLDRLTRYICNQAVDKNKKVRMSKWHVVPLDENQQLYAAIDVYIGQIIYNELKRRLDLKKETEAEFLAAHGEKAFKAVQALGENFLKESNN